MAVSRKGQGPVLQRGHCSNWVKYLFTVLGAHQGGLVVSRLHKTRWKFLRKTDVALPYDTKDTQQQKLEWFSYLLVQKEGPITTDLQMITVEIELGT